ncbi:hypothetical protein PybrP1_007337 [[Pythium] brassicae (nom. inval.)]|nr:hypothetical protein PybrP1_007337 [[Pythium] brassicae (nom. inval.)]
MSAHDNRAKGKRFRKPQFGGSNVKERWKYLSAQTDDVLHENAPAAIRHKPVAAAAPAPTKHASEPTRQYDRLAPPGPMRLGYDIDGDGQIDVREMRLAKFLDAMMESRRQLSREQRPPSESELSRMRQEAGRLLIAKEFVERNHDRLWRYGSVFAGKSDEQGAEFIATHKNFKKLMPFLENLERKRTVRSSQNLRECMHHRAGGDGSSSPYDAQQDARLVRQTWVETSRKVPDAAFSRHPLPELQPRKNKAHPKELHPVSESIDAANPEVAFNTYGAIDVDGDGLVDDDEMKLNLRLQEATLDDDNTNHNSCSSHDATDPRVVRQLQQHEGRRMMAKDFVERNKHQLWLYEPSFRGQPAEQVAEAIAANAQFAKEFNRLRAKERVLRLKSSEGVSSCLEQVIAAELPADPTAATEFRRVRHRSELLLARRELLKPQELQAAVEDPRQQQSLQGAPQLRAVREARPELSRTRSDTHVAGLPKLFETPVRIEATGSFSVTKWKFGS